MTFYLPYRSFDLYIKEHGEPSGKFYRITRGPKWWCKAVQWAVFNYGVAVIVRSETK